MLFRCSECGWEYEAEDDFDGRHGREDAYPESTPEPCQSLAKKVEQWTERARPVNDER